jgi:hypothetical protein
MDKTYPLEHLARASETNNNSSEILSQSGSYAAAVQAVLIKSRIGRPQMGDKERDFTTGTWVEILYGVIPEHRLNDSYLLASRNKKDSFPIQPNDLCAAWNEIRESEMHKRAPESRQITHGFCGRCNNTGTELIRDANRKVKGARPCRH